MNCRVCGNPLFAGRATFRCSCGAITHGYCWEKHVLQAHEPSFEVGTVDLDGSFVVPTVEEEVVEAEVRVEVEAESEGGDEDKTAPAMIAAGEEEAE